MPGPAVEQLVPSGEVRVAVQTVGDPHAPTMVLVHGFPDTHAAWDLVVEQLAAEFRVVTYDVRGAGGSSAPAQRSGYRMARLVDDLVAVLEATSPDQPVHLVGHDWGSVQSWGAVQQSDTDPRLRGRIATYTTISGPALSQFADFVRSGLRSGRAGQVARQLAHSWYVGAFQVPVVPEWTFRHLGGVLRSRLARTERLGAPHWGPTFAADAAHGVNLYRANLWAGGGSGRARVSLPVQLLVPRHDAFLTPALYTSREETVDDLTRVDLDAGHWVIRTHAALVADHLRAFAHAHPART